MGLCPFTGKDTLNLLFMFVSATLLGYGPIIAEKGGLNSIFTFHPLCMSLGMGLMITMGFWMFNYEDLPGEWIDSRAGRRKSHAFCQICGVTFLCLGYAAVYRAHWLTSDGQFFKVTDAPWGFSTGPHWLRLTHIYLGYATLFAVAVQFVIGLLKYRTLTDDEDDNDNAFSYHETVGNFVYTFGTINVLLGVWLWEAHSLPVRFAISLTMLTSAAFGPRWDGSRGYLSDDAAPASKNKKAGQRVGKSRS